MTVRVLAYPSQPTFNNSVEAPFMYRVQLSYIRDSNDIINEGEMSNSQRVKLRFLTPARIKYNGKLITDANFEIVIRNLLRRLSSLAGVHCGEKWELDWKGLIERTKEIKTVLSDLVWKDWERYSQRQDTKLKMGGFLGEITFEGDLTEFMPFLKLKNRSFSNMEIFTKYGYKTDDLKLGQLPEDLKDEYSCRIRDGKILLGLVEDYELLSKLGDPFGKKFEQNKGRIIDAIKRRNKSISGGHGTTPLGEEDYLFVKDRLKGFIFEAAGEIQVNMEMGQLPIKDIL